MANSPFATSSTTFLSLCLISTPLQPMYAVWRVSREQYINTINKENVKKFFGGSYMGFISNLVKEHDVSVDELKELIKMVEEE